MFMETFVKEALQLQVVVGRRDLGPVEVGDVGQPHLVLGVRPGLLTPIAVVPEHLVTLSTG